MLFPSVPRGVFVPMTDPMQWHCVRCDARLALDGTRWTPGRPAPSAMFAEDAKKVCPPCAAVPVPSIEDQVSFVLVDAALRIALGR